MIAVTPEATAAAPAASAIFAHPPGPIARLADVKAVASAAAFWFSSSRAVAAVLTTDAPAANICAMAAAVLTAVVISDDTPLSEDIADTADFRD
jgi:hypothetical protein